MQNFEAIKITDNVYWVGAIDWSLRDFHGYSTSRGSTYNAYLILGKTPILIDTVKKPFFHEMMSRIQSIIDPQKIQYIISNHAEMDHAGALPETCEVIKPKSIFASKMGVGALKEHLHADLPLQAINNDQELSLDGQRLQFFETRMLHWPDSMFTFFANEGFLFSQDAFGMHLATSKLFADQNDWSIVRFEAAKYYANILMPYSPLVLKLLNQLPDLHLDIRFIAPDHGPIWRRPEDIQEILRWWQTWAKQESYKKIIIVYDTMWGSTAAMAAAIAEGASQEDKVLTQVMPLAGSHRSDIATEILEAGAILVGSPTINQQIFPTVADTLCYLKGLKRQHLIGQVFGSYGWSKEAIKLLQQELEAMSVSFVEQPIAVKYVPTETDLLSCRQLGKSIASTLQSERTK